VPRSGECTRSEDEESEGAELTSRAKQQGDRERVCDGDEPGYAGVLDASDFELVADHTDGRNGRGSLPGEVETKQSTRARHKQERAGDQETNSKLNHKVLL
jgi:hypothetical protein